MPRTTSHDVTVYAVRLTRAGLAFRCDITRIMPSGLDQLIFGIPRNTRELALQTAVRRVRHLRRFNTKDDKWTITPRD